MIRVVLLFALPQEYATLKRSTGPWQLLTRARFKTLRYRAHSKEFLLVETGMGQERMLEALEWLLVWAHPDLVIAAGFAGSLSPDLAVGDVCLGEVFGSLDLGSRSESNPRINLKISERLARFCDEHRIRGTQIISTNQPVSKQLLRQELANTTSVLDMESFSVGQFCCQNNLRFLAFRAISDGFLDEIDFDLAAISGTRGQVRIPLVLVSVLRSPRLVRSYYLSWKRSRKASESLGKALDGLLKLPPPELRTLIQENLFDLGEKGEGRGQCG
jgi:nucleoside phosphorylase